MAIPLAAGQLDLDAEPTKKFAHIVGVCRQAFVGVGLFSAAINILMLAVPLYMLQVYDRVLSTRNVDTLLALTVMAVGAVLVLAVLEAVRGRIMARVGIWLDRELAADMLKSGVAINLTMTEPGGGQGLRDLAFLRGYLGGPGLIPLFDAPFILLFLAVVFLIHPVLGWIATGGGIILFLLALSNELMTRRPVREANAQTMRALNETDLAMRNADVIEALGMLPSLQRRWDQASDKFLSRQREASDRSSAITATARFMRFGVQIAMLGVGAYLVIGSELTGGAMIAAAIIASRALAPVEQSIGGWRAYVTAQGAFRRIKRLAASVVSTRHTDLPAPEGRLSVQALIFVPPGIQGPILKDINFDLEPGTAMGLAGPTAAGKTTLARHLVGSLVPTLGHVRLDGADLAAWNPMDRGRYIGYLPQDVELFGGTVAENISRMSEAPDTAIVAAAKFAGVHELILGLPNGYATMIGETNTVLSGGQRQRIGLARAVFGQPKLVVLDEPNSNLDADGERALIETLARLKEARATVVLVAQKPQVMARMDKILVLREGAVQMFSDRAKILKRLQGPVAVESDENGPATKPLTVSDEGDKS
ncbi:MAG: type I secretion system permease/ATPase [Alphaproteobacteria bacterium]|nr:type I secretion system permease/ATPase [Alphaproteobacteria bacterium]